MNLTAAAIWGTLGGTMTQETALKVRMTADLRSRLKQQAEAENRSLAGFIRHALITYLEDRT